MNCARREFMELGYQNANMRSIARAAKVTTGALYNHFANKALLFDTLVREPAEEMLARFQEIHRQTAENISGVSSEYLKEQGCSGTDWMLDYIYRHMDTFRLIFSHSEGTSWSAYLERLIEIEEQAYRIYCDALSKDGKPVDDIFLHITAASGFQYLVEIVSHDLPYAQAVAVMDSVKRYGMAGWNEILGLSP